MTQIQQIVLNLTASALFQQEYQLPGDADWEQIAQEAQEQAVLPLVYTAAGREADGRYKAILSTNMAVNYEHTELHELMTEHGIPYVSMKGAASAAYYPQPLLRTMGDVDFLVHESDVAAAGKLLEAEGFVPEENREGIHIGYHRERSTWELHRSVNGVPDNHAGKQILKHLSDMIETAVEYDTGNGIVRIPDNFHHGLVLLLHTASHLTSEGVGLRHLCDWAVFVNHFEGSEFAALFQDRLTVCGLWRFAQLLTLVSVRYLHLPEQPWAGSADDDLLEQLITDIMDGGNFGFKDEDRYHQIKYISNRGEYSVDGKSPVAQVISTMNRKVRAEYAFVRKVPILMPVGWLWTGVTYLGLLATGKRKPDSRDTVKAAAKRKKIYQELHLFE